VSSPSIWSSHVLGTVPPSWIADALSLGYDDQPLAACIIEVVADDLDTIVSRLSNGETVEPAAIQRIMIRCRIAALLVASPTEGGAK
jgi:hypothetical protein